MAVFRLPVNLTWPMAGSPGVNVWHIRTAGELDPLQPLSNAVETIHSFYDDIAMGSWGGGQAGIYAKGVTISAEEAIDVETQEAHSVDFASIAPGVTDDPAPPSLQICVSWRTSIAARRGRGRTFLGPLGKAIIGTDGTPVDAAVSMVRTACQTLVDASGGVNDYAIGVYGLQTAGGGPTSPHVLRDITGFRVNDQFAILRSRRD